MRRRIIAKCFKDRANKNINRICLIKLIMNKEFSGWIDQ